MTYRFLVLVLTLAFCAMGSTLQAQEEGEAVPPAPESIMPTPDTTDAEGADIEQAPGTWDVEVKETGDVLQMPKPSDEPAPPRSLPYHGMNMNEVERHFGAPMTRHPAVGSPPITRWDYDGFSVFFEHHIVLHAVQQGRPAQIYRKDELLPATAR
jgi:hypothetical protein